MQKYVVYDSELGEYVGQDPDETDTYKVVYLASDVDARIAELENLLRECIADSGVEQFLGTDLLERVNRSLMEG